MRNEGTKAQQRGLLRRDGLVIAAFLMLTAVMTNPLVLHIADSVEDKQDGLLNTWIIAWVGHALVTSPLHLFDTNIFYPYAKSLAFSEILIPQGLLALPINLFSGNTILGYNLVLLFSFFLAAYGMYLLVFDWTKSRSSAFAAGVIFAFNPYNLGNLAQIQLLSFGWMPIAFLFLTRITRVGPDSRTEGRWALKASLLFAVFFSLQALSSIYYAMLAAFAVALYVTWTWLTRRTNFASYVTLALRLGLSVLVIAILTVPFLLPYLDVQRELGFARSIQESEPFSASAKLYTDVSSTNLLYGGLLSPRPPILNGGYPLDNLFPGIVAVALAIIGISARQKNKWFIILLLILALVLSLGPRLFIAPTLPTDITLPYRWLYDIIPLMHAFRAPVRFAALVMFTLAILAGFGVERLASRLGAFRYSPAIIPVILGLAISLEYLNLPAASIATVPTGNAVPQYVRWLASQPHGLALELPMIQPVPPLDLTTQYLSTYHWQDTPDGYSGFVPKGRGAIAYEMESFPGERSVSLLQALGVRYVILHSGAQYDASGSEWQDLSLVQRFGNDLVLQVAPRSQTETGLSVSLYLPQPALPGQAYIAYVILRNQASRSYAVKPNQALQVTWQYAAEAGQPERFELGETMATLPLVTTRASVIPIRLRAPLQVGKYQMQVSIVFDNLSEWHLKGDLRVANDEAASEVVLPASVALTRPLQTSYAAEDTVQVNLAWHALNKIDLYYSASVRVVDSAGNKVVAEDREPAGQTMLWRPDSIVPDQFELKLPPDLAKGTYTLQVLMYHADMGVDALLLDNDYVPRKTIELGKFDVK